MRYSHKLHSSQERSHRTDTTQTERSCSGRSPTLPSAPLAHLSRFTLSQESNFFYLTGCNVPASYVLLAFQPGAPKLESTPVAHLYIPKIQVADLMWSVP